MAWDITQLQMDYYKQTATVSVSKQGGLLSADDYATVTISFHMIDDPQERESSTEQRLKALAKKLILEAAHAL